MKALFSSALSMATIVVALSGAMESSAEGQRAKRELDPLVNDANAKDTRLSLEAIRRLRGKHTGAGKVADMVAEQGRAFEVTADVKEELRKLGFSPAQVVMIKDASRDPLVPGKYLSSTDAERDAFMELMRRATTKSGAAIEAAASQHVTLWAAKGNQKTYLADLQKAEKFFHTKCAEPIRSGLDRRMSHVVILNSRAEYLAWWRAVFALNENPFEVKDNPGASAQFRQDVFKSPIVCTRVVTVISAGEMIPEWAHRTVAFGAGFHCVCQLTNRSRGSLATGFGNLVESAVFGSPVAMASEMTYGRDIDRNPVPVVDWRVLLKQRLAERQATMPGDLLKADQAVDRLPANAERWALVGLLNRQPAKFGKLLLAIKHGDSDLAAIEKIYGWNEKELNRQFRVYGMSLGRR